MEKLPEVENAKALMNEAIAWSVMRWLREKKKVRKAADQANAALDQLRQSVQQRWPDSLRAAYESHGTKAAGAAGRSQPKQRSIDPEESLIAKKVKEADEDARRARMDAEDTFDEAERQLSTTLAREGCRKAIHSWELHEKAIRKAEAVVASK